MAETGISVSNLVIGGGVLGTFFSGMGAVAGAWINAKYGGKRKIEPNPLRIELQQTYATKEDLKLVEDRLEHRMMETLGAIRADITGMRKDLTDYNAAAEARTSAVHRRIDQVMANCATHNRSCK